MQNITTKLGPVCDICGMATKDIKEPLRHILAHRKELRDQGTKSP